MTLDGFLTVLALLAALYAVLPAVHRFRLGLAWKAQVIVGLLFAVPILALELYEFRLPACPPWWGFACRVFEIPAGETGAARKLAFLLAVAWLVLSIVVHARSRPSLGSIPDLSRVATELIDVGQHSDALNLLEPHIELLVQASRRKCRSQLLHDRIAQFGPEPEGSFAHFARPPEERYPFGSTWPYWAAKPVRAFASLLPSGTRAEEAARDILEMLFSSPRLLDFIVERRPYFGLALLRSNFYGAREFCERLLCRLIASPGSALYHELAGNLESEGMFGYRLPRRNRLLHHLFADARRASYLSAWQGIAIYVQRLLDGRERDDYTAWLNGDPGWYEDEQYRDPVSMAVLYFDIMVCTAAKQNIRGHMWLYYIGHFARGIEASYDSGGAGIDLEREFPVRGARLLYEMIRVLGGWVELYEHLPEGSIHREHPSRHGSPGTIPHCAAIALGGLLATVSLSPRIGDPVIVTLHSTAMGILARLHPDREDLADLREWLIDALLAGRDVTDRVAYWRRLANLLDTVDHTERDDLQDYEDALTGRLNGAGGS